jgi:excinuclease UvrABC nuclease subunit
VYVLKDAPGTVLYVGKGDALTRLREHIKDPKKTQWFGEIAHVEVWGTGLNNTKALALEEDLIGQLKPLHNVDKNPFYTEFGNTMDVGPNLPPAQKVLKFSLEWGH